MTLEEAISKYHFLQRNPETGGLEMFLDHHSMASFRMCQAKFELEILNNVRGKGREWSLDFGVVFHTMVERFYILKRDNEFEARPWVESGIELWHSKNLDSFSEHKTYKALGGLPGFMALLLQYSEFYESELDRLRPIGIEVPFGKKREVPLGTVYFYVSATNEVLLCHCYLTGRIDFLMDSGNAIGPLDHKTAAWFSGDMTENHDPQEGMTGYVYATSHIIKANFPDLFAGRKCDRVWMNYVQVKGEEDFNKRFKRIPIFKTEWQLEEYRLRQLQTMKGILELILSGDRPTMNTSVCNNVYHKKCPFHRLHRQNSPENMLTILRNDYEVAPIWDPEDMRD